MAVGGGYTAISYKGETVSAPIADQATGEAIAGDFLGSTGALGTGTAVLKAGSSSETLWEWAYNLTKQAAVRHKAGQEKSSVTLPCDAGSITFTENLDPVLGTGPVSVTLNNCQDLALGITTKGRINMVINTFDPAIGASGEPTDANLEIVYLNFNDGVDDITISATMGRILNIGAAVGGGDDTETGSLDVVVQDNNSGLMFAINGGTMTTVYDDFVTPTTRTEDYSGEFCVSLFGCVSVATTTPVNFASDLQDFPDAGGPIVLTGAAGGSGPATVTLTPQDANNVTVDVDVDGDGTPEFTNTVLWTSL